MFANQVVNIFSINFLFKSIRPDVGHLHERITSVNEREKKHAHTHNPSLAY